MDPEDITIGSGEAASISTALNSGSNVSIKTSDSGSGKGDINVNGHIAKTEGDDASLTLQAHNTININGSITSTSNKLDVKLVAGAKVNINGTIDSNGGSISTRITGIPDEPEEIEEIDEDIAEAEPEANTEESAPSSSSNSEEIADQSSTDSDSGSVDEQSTHEPGDEIAEAVVDAVEEIVSDTGTGLASEESDTDFGSEVQDLLSEIEELNQAISNEINIAGEVITHGGDIEIDSGNLGDTYVSGVLDSSNLDSGEVGGDIHVLGNQVALFEDASIDASGDLGGGEILIGGDFQGNNPDIRNAQNTYVGRDVTINSNAITSGDGGKVIVWADNNTRYYGNISATGGELGGDGGDAEVSGKQNLDFNGLVDLSANNGTTGSLLLDPDNVAISFASGQADDGELGDNEVNFGDGGALFIISEAALEASLAAANTTIQANDTINVNRIINWTSASNLILTTTTGDIQVTSIGEINGTNAGAQFLVNAGGAFNAEGDITANGGVNITAANGSITTEKYHHRWKIWFWMQTRILMPTARSLSPVMPVLQAAQPAT